MAWAPQGRAAGPRCEGGQGFPGRPGEEAPTQRGPEDPRKMTLVTVGMQRAASGGRRLPERAGALPRRLGISRSILRARAPGEWGVGSGRRPPHLWSRGEGSTGKGQARRLWEAGETGQEEPAGRARRSWACGALGTRTSESLGTAGRGAVEEDCPGRRSLPQGRGFFDSVPDFLGAARPVSPSV